MIGRSSILSGAACALAALLLGCGTARAPQSLSADSGEGARTTLQDVPERVRRIAEIRIQDVSGSEAARAWQGATLGREAIPLYRPDVEGVAYYEIPVSVNGERTGVITVSTGPHDFPVVFWSDRATGEAALLLQRAAQSGVRVHRIQRLGLVDYVAEDARGEVVLISRGSMGSAYELVPIASPPARMERSTYVYEPPQPGEGGGPPVPESERRTGPQGSPYELRAASSWAEVKARYAAHRAPALAALRQEAAGAWSAIEPFLAGLRVPSPTPGRTYFEVEAPSDVPDYDQIDANVSPNTTPCDSGCGATAWAIVAGWIDRRAPFSAWASGYGRIVMNGSTDVLADLFNSSRVNDLIWSIRDTLGTECSSGVPAGWTLPYKMERMTDWMKARSIGLAVATDYSAWFVTYDHIRIHAVSQIRNRRPAILGTGAGTSLHFPVAIAYQELPLPGGGSTAQEFYVHMGWGGDSDGWIPASTWFSGTLAPAIRPNTGRDCAGLSGRDYLCCMKPYLPDC